MHIFMPTWLALRPAPKAAGLFTALSLLLLASSTGCERAPTRQVGHSTAPSVAAMSEPYPPGSWRLDAYALENVALTLSHILIAHEGSQSGEASNLRAPNWSAERKATRSKQSARERAAQIAVEARLAPSSFEGLALRYSDDLVTREHGGALGTWTGDVLPSEFLDALAQLKPGETSRVVETALGFHVLKRRATPAAEQISARRILISYQPTAPFLFRRGRLSTRTREEARALAEQVAKRARERPDSFGDLVDQYSEHSDALRGGDIGVWSTARAFPWSRELERMAELEVGQVSQPIDSMEGFNIFLRSAVGPRQRLAVDEIVLSVASGADGPNAREIVRSAQLQRKVLRELQKHPDRFASYQDLYCCKERREWSEGKGVPELELRALALGMQEVTALPFEPESSIFRIIRRVPASAERPLDATVSELPAPPGPNIDALVSRAADGDAVASYVLELAKSVPAELELDDQQKRQIDAVVTRLVADLKTSPAEQRVSALREARGQFAAILGERLYAQLRASVDRRLSQQMMPQ